MLSRSRHNSAQACMWYLSLFFDYFGTKPCRRKRFVPEYNNYYINLIYKRAQWSAKPESQANKIQGNCYSKTEGFSTCTAALVGYVVSLPLVEEWSIVMSMSVCKHIFRTTSWWLGVVVSGVRCMNEVNARRAQLVPGWVTVFRRVYNLGM